MSKERIKLDKWEQLLIAWLHDPPDKAFNLRRHEERSQELIKQIYPKYEDDALFGKDLTKAKKYSDGYSAFIERLPQSMPYTSFYFKSIVKPSVDEKSLNIMHPLILSDESSDLNNRQTFKIKLEKYNLSKVIENAFDSHCTTNELKFMYLWRFLLNLLYQQHNQENYLAISRIPADTRCPDISIWNHMDSAAGFKAAQLDNYNDHSLLAFSLGPVQSYIDKARSLRDLWTGSYLLSWLTFKAMEVVIDEYGPTSIVFPYLRGLPLLDKKLKKDLGEFDILEYNTDPESLKVPSIPNRFVAIVPSGDSKIEEEIKKAVISEINNISNEIRKRLKVVVSNSNLPIDWDRRWEEQTSNYFDIRTAKIDFKSNVKDKNTSNSVPLIDRLPILLYNKDYRTAFPDLSEVARMNTALGNKLSKTRYFGEWQMKIELINRFLDSKKSVRLVPDNSNIDPQEYFPPKCTIFGSFEQLGPDLLGESEKFWEEFSKAVNNNCNETGGIRLHKKDRLCALGMIKRFAWPLYLEKELFGELKDEEKLKYSPKYDDTATLAASLWFAQTSKDEDNQKKTIDDFDYATTAINELWDLKVETNESDKEGKFRNHWFGNWIHWKREDQGADDGEITVPKNIWTEIQRRKRIKKPPAYYAILMIDGDNMGKWLKGKNAPRVKDILHPKAMDTYKAAIGDYNEKYQDKICKDTVLNAKRPVSPGYHAAISEALGNFSIFVVPEIVNKFGGTVIYSGGDDVLAALPLETALQCANELKRAFRGEKCKNRDDGFQCDKEIEGFYCYKDKQLMMMGTSATVSAGIVLVHYKEDLRYALDQARKAEKMAKSLGRDSLVISACKASSDHSSVFMKWEQIKFAEKWIERFGKLELSDRWAYTLDSELEMYRGQEFEQIIPEMLRIIERSGTDYKDFLKEIIDEQKEYIKYFESDEMSDVFQKHIENISQNSSIEKIDNVEFFKIKNFVKLVKTLSFMVRGRD